MTLVIPQPAPQYDRNIATRTKQLIEAEDVRNRKRGADIELGAERLIIRSPNGTRYQVVIGDGGGISAAAAVASGNALPAAWAAYIATLTPNVGTITQGGSSSFLQVGKIVFFSIDVTVTAVTGAPTNFVIDLPVAVKRNVVINGQEVFNTGIVLHAQFFAGTTRSAFAVRDTSLAVRAPTVNDEYSFTGSYEAA